MGNKEYKRTSSVRIFLLFVKKHRISEKHKFIIEKGRHILGKKLTLPVRIVLLFAWKTYVRSTLKMHKIVKGKT